jgi:hypothetical protein
MSESFLEKTGEKIASFLGQGKKKKSLGEVKGGSSSTAPASAPTKTDEDIFEQQSQMRNLVDKAKKATGKQVR